MAGKKKENEVMAPEGQVIPETPKNLEPQTKTYSQEEVDNLKRIAQEEADTKAWEKYQEIQRVVSKKDTKIQELESRIGGGVDRKTLDVLGKLASESTDPSIVATVEGLRAEADRLEVYQYQKSFMEGKKAELNQKIIEGGYDPSDPIFDTVDLAFELSYQDGKVERAFNRLNRILKANPKKEVKVEDKPKETEVELKERIKREIYEEAGLTMPEGLKPSGSGGGKITREMLARMTPQERLDALKEIRESIDKGTLK